MGPRGEGEPSTPLPNTGSGGQGVALHLLDPLCVCPSPKLQGGQPWLLTGWLCGAAGCTPPQPPGVSSLRPGSGSGQEGSARDERSERERPLLLGRIPYQLLVESSAAAGHLPAPRSASRGQRGAGWYGPAAGPPARRQPELEGTNSRWPTAAPSAPQCFKLHPETVGSAGQAASRTTRPRRECSNRRHSLPDYGVAGTSGRLEPTTPTTSAAHLSGGGAHPVGGPCQQSGLDFIQARCLNMELGEEAVKEMVAWLFGTPQGVTSVGHLGRPLKNSQAASATPRVWRCALHRLLHCAASTIAPCATEALLAQVLLDTLPVIVQCYQSLSPSRQRLPQFIADVAHLSSTVHCLTQPFTLPLPHNNSARHILSSITEVEIPFQLPLAAVQQLSTTVRQLCLHAGLLQLPADEMGLLVASAAGLQAGAACSSLHLLQPGPMPHHDNLRHPDQDSGVGIPPPFTRPSSATTRVGRQEDSPRSMASSATELSMPCSQPINAMQRPISSVRPALSCGGMPRSSTHNDPGTNTNGERRPLPPLRRGSWVQALRNMPPPPSPYCSPQDARGKEPHGYLTEGDPKASLLVGSHGLPGSVPFSSGPLATDHLPIVVQQPWAQADHAIHLEDVWRCPRGLWAGPSRTLATCQVSDSMALQHSDNPPWSWLTSSIAQQLAGQPLGPKRYFNPLAHMDCTNILVSGVVSAMWRNVLSTLARNARPCEVLHAIYKRSELHEEVTGLPMDDQERNDRGALRAIASYAMLRH
ncbi:uncharacterized protein HaLaN_28892 [Haematococcus lacustris]|uniref:Uncharacterized protein n=1 Tax=Haematococcus lacustris TaxID=44745 RepID=A0A6A0AE22_HAELA|nr:uncharacterized protein HaLaN_28892 [Haematococcus lacustris]